MAETIAIADRWKWFIYPSWTGKISEVETLWNCSFARARLTLKQKNVNKNLKHFMKKQSQQEWLSENR